MDKTSRSRNLAQIVSSYTPPVYRPAPITAAEANAFGKWHLLAAAVALSDDGEPDEDSLLEAMNAAQNHGSRSSYGMKGGPTVHDHATFEVNGPKVTRLCSTVGIVLEE
jgi:hypothetical protein